MAFYSHGNSNLGKQHALSTALRVTVATGAAATLGILGASAPAAAATAAEVGSAITGMHQIARNAAANTCSPSLIDTIGSQIDNAVDSPNNMGSVSSRNPWRFNVSGNNITILQATGELNSTSKFTLTIDNPKQLSISGLGKEWASGGLFFVSDHHVQEQGTVSVGNMECNMVYNGTYRGGTILDGVLAVVGMTGLALFVMRPVFRLMIENGNDVVEYQAGYRVR